MNRLRYGLFAGFLLAGLLLSGCQPVAPETASTSPLMVSPLDASPAGAYSDPFAYCAAVGTVDAPDERYNGPETPEAIARKMRDEVFASPAADLEVYMRGMHWRCMDGTVMACHVGANLPCLEKADTSREPNEAMQDFCAENPGSGFIPAYITGRATIYTWLCDGETAVAGEPITEVDERGFLSFIWHPITP